MVGEGSDGSAQAPVGLPVPGPATPGLPVVGQPPAERVDAARNRRKILDAAARILREHGSQALSFDELSRAAGVGVGTVYRRFGDRAGLVFALLDEGEREFQESFLHGPPPLGPGASAADRIHAFLHALVDRIEAQVDLLLVAETSAPHARYRSGPYSLYHTHLVTLLAQARPGTNAHFVAAALLAPVSATFLSFQRRERGLPVEEIKAGLDDLLTLGL